MGGGKSLAEMRWFSSCLYGRSMQKRRGEVGRRHMVKGPCGAGAQVQKRR